MEGRHVLNKKKIHDVGEGLMSLFFQFGQSKAPRYAFTKSSFEKSESSVEPHIDYRNAILTNFLNILKATMAILTRSDIMRVFFVQ